MPELPEVETIRRDLRPSLLAARLEDLEVRLPKLLRPGVQDFRERLLGAKLRDIRRRGKLLIFDFGKNLMLVHLGLTGALIYRQKETGDGYPPHTHLIFSFDQGWVFYADLRQFGWLEALPADRLKDHPFYSSLGPDALGLSWETFQRRLAGRRRQIKALLLDQKVIAGLGNIYTDEALFRAGVHPRRSAASLSEEELRRLYEVLQEILERALVLRGSSVRNYVDGQGEEGRFQEEHLVYGRKGKPCPRCGTPLVYEVVAARGTTYCPHCQPLA